MLKSTRHFIFLFEGILVAALVTKRFGSLYLQDCVYDSACDPGFKNEVQYILSNFSCYSFNLFRKPKRYLAYLSTLSSYEHSFCFWKQSVK